MTISNKSSERLTAMQTLLTNDGWTKGSMHDYQGRCLLGAVLFVHDRYATPVAWADPRVREDLQWLHEAAAMKDSCDCGGCMTGHARAERLMAWNDSPQRTFADVMGAFDRAIAGARAAEVTEAPAVPIRPHVPEPSTAQLAAQLAAMMPPSLLDPAYVPPSFSYVVRYATWAPLQMSKVTVVVEEEEELVGV